MNQNFATYDMMESTRQAGAWMGATAKAFWSNPVFGLMPSPVPATMAAWGQVTEHAFNRMIAKPGWGIETVLRNGRDCVVTVEAVLKRPFGDLVHFKTERETTPKRKVLLIAPMSGHYATLLRKTVISLLPDCDVYIT
ncbi:MAG: polyhydroxyalkanoate depolymerase, partial [Alphaproteobacteria bacterium]|nr:polyhydroxyalkanoate depolymerase [Alphaproteobacteria bacterium]